MQKHVTLAGVSYERDWLDKMVNVGNWWDIVSRWLEANQICDWSDCGLVDILRSRVDEITRLCMEDCPVDYLVKFDDEYVPRWDGLPGLYSDVYNSLEDMISKYPQDEKELKLYYEWLERRRDAFEAKCEAVRLISRAGSHLRKYVEEMLRKEYKKTVAGY